MYNFQANSRYTFETYSPSILGQRHIGVRCLVGNCDYKFALSQENVHITQTKVQSDLPAGAPSDPSKNTYCIFETAAGTKLVLAIAWIAESSIVQTNFNDLSVVIHNAQPEDAIKVKQVLGAAGYNMVTVNVV